jgi:monovalent cation:H+ antiporter-2, CPA2 family
VAFFTNTRSQNNDVRMGMANPINPADFKEILVVLTAAAVVIPIFHRLKLSPILGFILIGMAVGPFGLGQIAKLLPWLEIVAITDQQRMALVGELGIVLLLFMIGLEMSWNRLRTMRKLVLGLGSWQFLSAVSVLWLLFSSLGLAKTHSLILSLALALSSTAIVIQVLAEQRRLSTPTGRASFAVLLYQDIMVIPILFVLGWLGTRSSDGAIFETLGLALLQAALGVVLVVLVGRRVLRPLFRLVAQTKSPELFMAACLLVILSMGLAMSLAGLSMALGALIAGILLAETEYRRQIEVTIEPFKGLALGVFLITIGMGLDLARLAESPIVIIGGALVLIVVKTGLVMLGARFFGLTPHVALKTGLLLAPGSEFSFVILGIAASSALLPQNLIDDALLIAAFTMAMIPILSLSGQRLTKLRLEKNAENQELKLPSHEDIAQGSDEKSPVIIVGYGRVGSMVASLLKAHDMRFIALDTDISVVTKARQQGLPVYYGDATSSHMLTRCGLTQARALVVTSSTARIIDDVVAAALRLNCKAPIIARARDARHAASLYQQGVSDAVPDTIEASLQLSQSVLVDIGIPMGRVIASIHEKRAVIQKELMEGKQITPPTHAILATKPRARSFFERQWRKRIP